MRNISQINDDIQSAEKKIPELRKKLDSMQKEVEYRNGAGVRSLVYIIIFAILAYLYSNGIANDRLYLNDIPNDWIMCIAFCGFVPLLFISSIKFCTHSISKVSEIVFLCFFSIIFVLSVYTLSGLNFSYLDTIDLASILDSDSFADIFNLINEENLHSVFKEGHRFISGDNYLTIQVFLVTSFTNIVSILILFVGSVVKAICGSAKEIKTKGIITETEKEIKEAETNKKEYIAELKEFDTVFESARVKNDAGTVKDLSELGYEKAKDWYDAWLLKEEQKKALPEYLIALAGKDYKKIQTIADKCGLYGACLDTAEHLLLQDFTLMTKNEKKDSCKKAQMYLQKVFDQAEVYDPNAEYLYAVSECFSASYEGDQWKVVLNRLRTAKESPELKPGYRDCIDTYIKAAIDCIEECSAYDEEQKIRKQKNELARKDLNNYIYECNYKAGGWCNYKNMTCQYPANVRKCYSASLKATYIGPEY